MCSNVNPIKCGEFNLPLDYPSIKNEENICRYMASWCQTCRRTSTRRRSQSESLEPCRKKTKEMKVPTVKHTYLDNQEYENMELEFEMKDGWYDCCRLSSSLNETNDHQFYDCCDRVRSNLCELPTSYIRNTNNCQSNQALSNVKMSDCDKDFVDCLENRVRSYDKSIKYVEYSEDSSVLDDKYEKCKKNVRFDNRLQKNCEKLEGIQAHFNGVVKYGHLEELKADSCQLQHDQKWNSDINILEMKTNSVNIPDNHLSDLQKDRDKYCQTDPCCLSNVKINNFCDYSLNYETQTYFDVHVKDGKGDNLSNLYNQEMENLKEKLKELKNNAYKNSTSAKMVAESLVAKDREMEEKQKVEKIYARDTARILRRPKSRLIRVKTRGSRMINTVKLRRSNTRTNLNSRPTSTETESIQSDYSDSDESIKETEEDSHIYDISPEDSASKEPISLSDTAASGDSTLWPIRESLFPNVPPYIAFSAFNAEESRKIPIGRKFFKWKLSTITPVIVRKVLTNSGFVMVRKSNQWVGTWGKHMKSPMFKTLKDSQKFNHFPGTFQLGRKDRLWRNFQRMINAFGHKEFGFLPHTYVLPHELKLLKYNWENKNSGGEWWIIKPPASARGVGIKVINKWAQLPKKTSLVVQKYITNPYLINGSKFDLRLYVLVTSFNPLRVYLYTEGLVRFASVKYSTNAKDIKEKYMHLTNYSINKLSSNYTANEDAYSAQGHKWTITKLLEYLSMGGVDTVTLWKNLEMLVLKTMIACEPPITDLCTDNLSTRYNCYELFGIDVLLDSKLKPWLLEVNISPSLHSASPLDEHVKGPMVQTLFNLAQFHFPSRLANFVKPNFKCYEPKLYGTHLTMRETSKHNKFRCYERRDDYLESILQNLTGDDVRHLLQAEDELRVKDKFKRIFPTASTHKLLHFMEPRYYNRLFDAWEAKYENNREQGIQRLQALCNERIHFKGASLAGIQKNGQTTNRGAKAAAPKEKDSSCLKEIIDNTVVVQEETTVTPSTK